MKELRFCLLPVIVQFYFLFIFLKRTIHILHKCNKKESCNGKLKLVWSIKIHERMVRSTYTLDASIFYYKWF